MAKPAVFTIVTAKTHSKTRLVQYVIIAKNPLKTTTDTLHVMLSNFKKDIPQDFHLLALWSAVDPPAVGVWAQFLSQCRWLLSNHTHVILINICPQRHSLPFNHSFYGLCYWTCCKSLRLITRCQLSLTTRMFRNPRQSFTSV